MVDYKLRLGDGTTFSVDEKGLTTWLQGGLVDDKARVQPAGSKKWFSLKQVLAAQGAQRGHAVRQTEKGRADVDRQAAEETAEIERKVAEQRAAEERKSADDLAAAERKAIEDRTAAERKLIEEREAAERRAVEEREAAQARAAEERAAAEAQAAAEKQAEQERRAAERLAAEERAAAERRAAEAREAERVAAAERLVAAERAERAERKRKAEEARLEAEQRAAEEARLAAERKAAEKHASERKAEEERAAAKRREAEAKEAAAREAERVAEAERLVAAERAERAERKRKAEEERLAEQRAADERLAEERRAADARLAEERRAANERLAAQRRAEDERAARERDAAMEAVSASALSEPPETEIAIEPAATMVKVEDFERELGLVPVTFNDGTDPAGRDSSSIRVRATSPSADRSEPKSPSRDGEAAPRVYPKPPTAVDNAVLRLLKVIDRAVIWVVRTLAPLVGSSIARAASSLESAGPKLKGLLARRRTSAEPAPADRPADVSTAAPAPWAAPPSPPPVPWAAPPPAPARAPSAAREAPTRKPEVPPPSFQKMEVIPFAASAVEPKSDDDVWDGEDVWQEPGAVSAMFAVTWLWVKRVTIATALIVTVALLALNREKWLPQAKDAATVLGQNVDKLQESTRTVPPEAIEAAHAEIPFLAPPTIELILAKSSGVLEPAEVFRRAHQAAVRARPVLPIYVVGEIEQITDAAAAELEPAEGDRLRAYLADVRAGAPTAAYQDKEAVWLMGRGVRRLPPERLARLQELFAQAVAAGLTPPS